jgi:hypothetical protein
MSYSKLLPSIGDNVLLSSSVTIAKYKQLEKELNQEAIAKFIWERFYERYLSPFLDVPDTHLKSAFSMMANACLMIEALESFYRGWENTRNKKGEKIYNSYFGQYQEFVSLRGFGDPFYTNIRCGILNQTETIGEWIICRDQPKMFDPDSKVIDANLFMIALRVCLDEYCDELRGADWESLVWVNFRKKMAVVIRNCHRYIEDINHESR